MRPSRLQAVRDRRRPTRFVLTIAVLFLSLVSGLGPASGASAAESPARDGAQVVAQGIVALPDPEVAWNVLALAAGPLDASGTINADGQSLLHPGFVVATDGPIITVTPDGTFLHRLNPGEAAFTPGDALVNPLSLTPNLLQYYGITLLPTSGQATEAVAPFYTSESFAITPSVRDLDLVRATLQAGESTSLNSGEFPALFLVTAGPLELVTPTGQSAVLLTGEAITYAGEITITNPGPVAATFVSAIIGDEATAVNPNPPPVQQVPPAPPVTDANYGSITVRAFECSPKQGPEGVCQPIISGFQAQLNLPNGQALNLDAAVRDGDAFRWEGLTVNPDQAQNLFVYTPSQTVSPPGHAEFEFFGDVSNVGTIALFESKPHAEFEIFNYLDVPQTNQGYGSFTIEVLVCPVPAVQGSPDPRDCATLDSRSSPTVADLNFSIANGSSLLYPDSTRADSATWLNVPPGTYTINQNSSSFGIHSAQVRGQTLVCCQAGAFFVNLETDKYDVRDTLFLYFASPESPSPLLDSDLDGLPDADEPALFLDPLNPDTDGDDLADGDEINYYGTDPTKADTDADAFTDGEEITIGSSPTDPLNTPLYPVPLIDPEPHIPGQIQPDPTGIGNGLTTKETHGQPLMIDSENQPADQQRAGDEVDPTLIDSDFDGFPDADEVNAGSDPFDPASIPGSVQSLSGVVDTSDFIDSDFDGFSDVEEVISGTDASDPASTP